MANTREIEGLSKWRWRELRRGNKWVTQRRVDETVLDSYDTMNPDELSMRIGELGLSEATLEIDHDQMADYGSCRYSLKMSGWRDATDAEIGEEWDRVLAEKKQRDEWDRRQAEDLKRRRPELFE